MMKRPVLRQAATGLSFSPGDARPRARRELLLASPAAGDDQNAMAVTADRLTLVRVCALLLVALALVPGAAYVSELPNKIALPREHYMLVQQIYRGWALFGIPIFAALAATAAQALLLRHQRTAFRLSAAAFLCLAAAQAVFWRFTYPVNVASANWTRIPEGFEAARRQWEYSHAVGAALTGAALIALILCHVGSRRGD